MTSDAGCAGQLPPDAAPPQAGVPPSTSAAPGGAVPPPPPGPAPGLMYADWYVYLAYTTATDARRQGFHDRSARTVVVKPILPA